MTSYVVLYRVPLMHPLVAPFLFFCQAETGDTAEDKCLEVLPSAEVVWVVEGSNGSDALRDYWGAVHGGVEK